MCAAFTAATDAWRVLLEEHDYVQFLYAHFDTVMTMAVALAQAKAEAAIDWDAIRTQYSKDEDEQTLLSLVFAIQDLLEVIVRENMAFLVDDAVREVSGSSSGEGDGGDGPSASQRDTAAYQEAQIQRLPEAFRLAFIKTLRTHWTALCGGAVDRGVRLNRLERMSWRVARPYVLLRIITSDHKQRILKVSMSQFHQLRYSTAKVLQEMNQVEAHPMLRLTNLEQSMISLRGQQQGDAMP